MYNFIQKTYILLGDFMKKYLFSFIFIICFIMISTLIFTFFNYINFINKETLSIFKITISFFSLFLGGIYIGRHSNKSGYLEGLKIGLIFIVFLLILNLLLHSFELKNLFYYLILILSSIFGSIIGIQKKGT